MGRRRLPVNETSLLEMRKEGKSIKEIAETLEISTATLSRRIAELTNREGILTKYRELQGLQLTELQFSLLESFTVSKLEEASLVDLARCYGILAKAIARIEGKESFKIHNLLSYLLELERTGFKAIC